MTKLHDGVLQEDLLDVNATTTSDLNPAAPSLKLLWDYGCGQLKPTGPPQVPALSVSAVLSRVSLVTYVSSVINIRAGSQRDWLEHQCFFLPGDLRLQLSALLFSSRASVFCIASTLMLLPILQQDKAPLGPAPQYPPYQKQGYVMREVRRTRRPPRS